MMTWARADDSVSRGLDRKDSRGERASPREQRFVPAKRLCEESKVDSLFSENRGEAWARNSNRTDVRTQERAPAVSASKDRDHKKEGDAA